MDATQKISDSILESDEEEHEEENENKKRPLAKLCILKNEYIPETELPLFMGDNVLGRDPNTCTLVLSAPSISKQHASISVYRTRGRHSEMDMEALVWDLGSMNGTHKSCLKLTPNVRYALSDGDRLVLADIPCHFVSCALNASQGDLRTPARNFRGKAELPEVSGLKGGTGSNMRVDRETKAKVSSPKTPVSADCLSIEQTPAQPQGTLVPESDSESEDERQGKRTRGRMALASDSDSHKSSPTCSTFLSPINKVVPESEDESPITPSSSFKRGPIKDLSLSKEETEVDMEQQQQMQQRSFGLTGDDDLPVCTPEVSTNPVASFNMDSDTDMEGEDEGLAPASHVMLNSNHQPPNTDQFHMDTDTDVDDDDEGALHKVPKTVPSSDEHVKPLHVISVIQPEGISVDSDTDVDDDPALSDAARKAQPMSSACTADTAPSKQQKDFCLDSDTDVDEEAERECGQNKSTSKIDASQTRLDAKSLLPDSNHAVPHRLPLDSDTDDEAQPTPALSEAPKVFAPTTSWPADTGADFTILPDSDTDVETDSPLVTPAAATTMSVAHSNMSEALHSDSSADTSVEESNMPPAGNVDNPADHRVEGTTDVDCKETDIQIPEQRREVTSGFPLSAQPTCSTPVQSSDGDVENMDTQTFMSPSSVSLRCLAVPAAALSSCSDSQEEEDFVVAETQSFVLPTKDCQGNPTDDHIMEPICGLEPGRSNNGRSFHLGLSDSSHLQCQAQDMEMTQAFVPVDKNLNLEDTQAYAAVSTADTATAENTTEAYGVSEEPATCSVMSEKVHVALEATQAYISENEMDEIHSSEETQPLDCPTSSTLAIAETQPMSGFEEEESLASEMEGTDEREEAAQCKEQFFSKAVCLAETQPMHTCDDEDPETPTNAELSAIEPPVDTVEVGDSDEDSIPVSRKRKAQQLEETQSLCSPGGPLAETQRMVAVGDSESDEDLIPGPRKRKAKPLQLEEEQTQPLTNSDLSVVETQPVNIAQTQPMVTSGKGESDVESEAEKTPDFVSTEISDVETKPKWKSSPVEDGNSDEEDSGPVSRKRRAKPRQLEETQPTSSCEVSTLESQPMGACDEESIKEDSIPGPSKLEQTEGLTNSDVCAVEIQATAKGEDKENRNESIRHPEPGTSGVQARLDEVESEKEEVEQPKKSKGKRSVSPQTDEKVMRNETEKGKTPEKEKVMEEHKDDENMLKVPTRGRRASRRTNTTQPKQDSTVSASDDVPAKRTRSRSNSSNSVSSERSASSVNTQEISGRGRGRGGKRISEPSQASSTRSSNRRRTVAVETSQQSSNDISPQGCRSRSNSSNSLNFEISSRSEIPQSRARGGRQRGRGRKTEADSIPPVSGQSDRSSAPKPGARGRKSSAAGRSTSAFQEQQGKAASLQAATRGQQQASSYSSEPVVAHEQGQSNQEGCHATQESLPSIRSVRARGQKAVKTEPLETLTVRDEAKLKRTERKREMVQNAEDSSSSSSKMCKEEAQTIATGGEEGEKNPVAAKRRGRASNTPAKRNTKQPPSEVEVKGESEDMEVETTGKRERGRPSAAQKKTREPDNSGTSVRSVSRDANMVAPQPRTPTSSVSQKRQIPVDSSPVAKTPRSSSASPAAGGRLQTARQSYKVLFTGLEDEAGERVLTRLGGSMAKGVSDMNCLVTDKVRRTVKFLCAVAKGVPIVTPHWLDKSAKAGSLLPPHPFLVKDPEQEKKFSFSLQESLRTASSQPLLQGYQIHITKSVKPEPLQMKDIISCSGATFLPKMPSSHKLQTIVVSCEEDWLLCGPAVSASLPVVTAEFILTGILQQKVDVQTHTLPPPASNPQPAGGKGRGRRRT